MWQLASTVCKQCHTRIYQLDKVSYYKSRSKENEITLNVAKKRLSIFEIVLLIIL